MKTWVGYSLFRILLFAAVLTVLLLIGITGWIAAIMAAIISFCVSYLFFGRARTKVATQLYKARNPDPAEQVTPAADSDEAAEDGPDDAADAARNDRPAAS